jgi:uncharacterized protein (DUF2164 family)
MPTLPTSLEIQQQYHQLAAEFGDLHFKKQALEDEVAAKVAQIKKFEAQLLEFVERKLHLHNALQEVTKAEADAAAKEAEAQKAVWASEQEIAEAVEQAK